MKNLLFAGFLIAEDGAGVDQYSHDGEDDGLLLHADEGTAFQDNLLDDLHIERPGVQVVDVMRPFRHALGGGEEAAQQYEDDEEE